MFKDCTTCTNTVYTPDFDAKVCTCYNHLIRDVDKYVDCVSHISKESEEQPNAQMVN